MSDKERRAVIAHEQAHIHRVDALFQNPKNDRKTVGQLLAGFVLGAGAVFLISAIFAESLHHLLETILG